MRGTDGRTDMKAALRTKSLWSHFDRGRVRCGGGIAAEPSAIVGAARRGNVRARASDGAPEVDARSRTDVAPPCTNKAASGDKVPAGAAGAVVSATMGGHGMFICSLRSARISATAIATALPSVI